jgi:hypothetical protein
MPGLFLSMNKIILLFLTCSFLGCTTMPLWRGRSSIADDMANQAGFTKEYIKAGRFTLMTYQRLNNRSDTVSIYIEGDGRAWESKHRLSDDPTPSNPVALRLAVQDPADNIVYMARPGQYSPSGLVDCDSRYWSALRFAPEVVESMDGAIDRLKEKSGAKYVELVGYSGGGAIAVLVAARRHDVIALRTVAGNLNTRAFCDYHHVSQMDGSVNPIDVAPQVVHVPQRHFIGSKDKIVPFVIAETFVKMEGDKNNERITVVDDVSHNDGWPKRWRELLLIPCQ